jgi:hypothetical protein
LCQAIRERINKIIDTQVFIVELFFHQSGFYFPGLFRIVSLRVVYALPEAFTVLILQITHNVLINVIEFVKEGLEV